MRKIYKYPTGAEIPEGAIYLCTKVEITLEQIAETIPATRLVWHYFLVEVNDE